MSVERVYNHETPQNCGLRGDYEAAERRAHRLAAARQRWSQSDVQSFVGLYL